MLGMSSVAIAPTADAAVAHALVGNYSYCSGLSSIPDCLVWPYTATGIGPLTIGNPDYGNWFIGYYLKGTTWTRGAAGIVFVDHGGTQDILTGVIAGTHEQIQTTYYDPTVPDWFWVGY